MADGEPRSVEEIATKAGVDSRYLKELLSANAANEYVNYDAESERFYLSPEQIAVFATEESPANMHGLLQIIVAQYAEHETAVDVFRSVRVDPGVTSIHASSVVLIVSFVLGTLQIW